MAIQLNFENFEKIVLGSVTGESTPFVLVDFFATWCGPCQMLSPIIDELSDEFEKDFPGKISVCKLDIDSCADIARNYNVMSVPTLILFKDGKEIHRTTGTRDKQELKNTIIDLMSSAGKEEV